MDTSNGKMHFLVFPGLGDLSWVMAKFLPLKDRVKFWFNNDQYKRQAPYADLLGLEYGFCDVDIARLYEAPGEWSEEKIKEGGFIGYLHANHHIEAGKRIEDWHPFLPLVNPAPFGRWVGETPYKNTSFIQALTYKGNLDPKKMGWPIAVHMAHATYQEGNWLPKQWARALKAIEDNYGPALVVGAFWDKRFSEQVFEHYRPSIEPMIDQPLGKVLTAIRGSRAMIGLDSGMAILSKYMGVPTAQYYPKWLRTDTPSKRHPNGTHMPGAWEFDHHDKCMWGFVEDALDKEADTYFGKWLDTL